MDEQITFAEVNISPGLLEALAGWPERWISDDEEIESYGEIIRSLPHYWPHVHADVAKAWAQADQDTRERLKRLEEKTFGEPGTSSVVRACDIEEKPVRWLWDGRVPLGKLTLID